MVRWVCLAVWLGAVVLCATPAQANIFGSVRGTVADPQGRVVAGATVLLQGQSSEWTRQARTDADGRFAFMAVPIGDYVLTVVAPRFRPLTQAVDVASGAAVALRLTLTLATVKEQVTVSAAPAAVDTQSPTTRTLVSRAAIARTPGADAPNSLAMITNYVPGAYLVHDQLHVRGGHQVTWQVDGVPVPNTNIASNVGPQFDPKDVDELEVQRGGYSAEYGNRTYAVFNVMPRTGFEGTNFVDLSAAYGSFGHVDGHADYGSHAGRLGYYASVSASRSGYGLETPVPETHHDATSGLGAFSSVVFNADPSNQLRLVASARGDRYQVPNDPAQQAVGVDDVEHEADAFLNVSWVHSSASGLLVTVSPFYHFNRAHYIGRGDLALVPEDDCGSQYAGAEVTVAWTHGPHDATAGAESFLQRDNTFFGLTGSGGGAPALAQRVRARGSLNVVFAQERFRATSWLTLDGGLRLTRFDGAFAEHAASPRLGATVRLGPSGLVLRGSYGRYYQAPPLNTISGPLLAFALDEGFDFLPLKGERDAQWEVGLAIPVRGWTIDVDGFHTRARNFFDHDALGNSDIFFPLTIAQARIRGFETTVRLPRLADRVQAHLAYSNQQVEGRGAVSGGLTDFEPPDEGWFYLDHDQRQTVSAGAVVDLPGAAWISGNLMVGSGFLNGDGPDHLPAHGTFDLAVGKDLPHGLSVRLTALNVADVRYLLDASNTFGGTHFNEPRQVLVELRYRHNH